MALDKLTPDMATLVALGSLVVHVEEYFVSERVNPPAAEYDRSAIETILALPSVREWTGRMAAMAFLPEKRQ